MVLRHIYPAMTLSRHGCRLDAVHVETVWRRQRLTAPAMRLAFLAGDEPVSGVAQERSPQRRQGFTRCDTEPGDDVIVPG
jgi:hypothetical protein